MGMRPGVRLQQQQPQGAAVFGHPIAVWRGGFPVPVMPCHPVTARRPRLLARLRPRLCRRLLARVLVYLCLCLFAAIPAAHAATSAQAPADDAPQPTTVFLVCEGDFLLESEHEKGVDQELFDGSLYVSITYTGDEFNKIQLQPFERDERLPAQHFEPTASVTDTATPASEQSNIRIHATEDEVIMHQTHATGATVRARIGDLPLVPTQMRVKTVDMTLNRFSGGMMMEWVDRRVGDFKPAGAIRATKVTYSDRKLFDAVCHTMKERLF